MKFFGKALVMTLLVAAIASPAMAKEINPWKDCGIGAMLFPDKDDEVIAVITNVTWDLGTTAVSSKVSSPASCEGADMVAATFINNTYTNLVEETAAGQGSHMASVLSIYGVDANAHASVSSKIRSEFASAVTTDGFAQKSQADKAYAYYQAVNSAISAQ
ncbi:MAG: DUF3015 family protein [bacterium]|nr:DUF3015 family protein [bacterium]